MFIPDCDSFVCTIEVMTLSLEGGVSIASHIVVRLDVLRFFGRGDWRKVFMCFLFIVGCSIMLKMSFVSDTSSRTRTGDLVTEVRFMSSLILRISCGSSGIIVGREVWIKVRLNIPSLVGSQEDTRWAKDVYVNFTVTHWSYGLASS